jgi:hypothetical protein
MRTLDEKSVRISKEILENSSFVLEDDDIPDLIERIKDNLPNMAVFSQFNYDPLTREIKVVFERDMNYWWSGEEFDNVEGALKYAITWSHIFVDDRHYLYARLKK